MISKIESLDHRFLVYDQSIYFNNITPYAIIYFNFGTMNIHSVAALLILFCVSHIGETNGQVPESKNTYMIRHTVVFKLKHPKDSQEEREFLKAIMKLSSIPGVHKFECLRQIGKKNDFDYGLSMEFDSRKTYDDYSQHPDHNAFVQTYWLKEVKNFLEIDYEPFK